MIFFFSVMLIYIISVSVEKALPIVCQPQAVFRIRSVNRCSATISGMKDVMNFVLSIIVMAQCSV